MQNFQLSLIFLLPLTLDLKKDINKVTPMTLPVPSCGGAVDLIHQWLPPKSGLEIDKVDLDIPDTTTEHEIGLRISNLFDCK